MRRRVADDIARVLGGWLVGRGVPVSMDAMRRLSTSASLGRPAGPAPARLVITHSSYCDGLLDALGRLRLVPGVVSIHPGVLSVARASRPHFDLRVSVPTPGGFKCIARKGRTVQEVFVVTSLSREELEAAVADSLPIAKRHKTRATRRLDRLGKQAVEDDDGGEEEGAEDEDEQEEDERAERDDGGKESGELRVQAELGEEEDDEAAAARHRPLPSRETRSPTRLLAAIPDRAPAKCKKSGSQHPDRFPRRTQRDHPFPPSAGVGSPLW